LKNIIYFISLKVTYQILNMPYISIIDILRIIIEIIGIITILKFIRRIQLIVINYIKERFNCIKLTIQTIYNKIVFLINLPNIMFNIIAFIYLTKFFK